MRNGSIVDRMLKCVRGIFIDPSSYVSILMSSQWMTLHHLRLSGVSTLFHHCVFFFIFCHSITLPAEASQCLVLEAQRDV